MRRCGSLKTWTGEEEVGRDDAGNKSVGQVAEITLKGFGKTSPREKELRNCPDQKSHEPHSQDYRDPRWIHSSIPQPTVPIARAATSQPQSVLSSAPGTAARKLAMTISSALFPFNSAVRIQAK